MKAKKLTNLFIVEGAGVVAFAVAMLVMYALDLPVYTYHPEVDAWVWGAAPDRVSLTFLGRIVTAFPVLLALDLAFHGYDLFVKKAQVEQNHKLVKLTAACAFYAALAMFAFSAFLVLRG